MSILRSFNIGVSGLSAAGDGMSVVSDNIANAGTFGFKASRPEFQDALALSLKGIDGGDQIGSGTRIAHVTPIFTQGPIQRTEQITDLAINGNGFFELITPFGFGYSRDGSFHFDKNGYLINGDSYRVQGFLANEKGIISGQKGSIRLGNTTTPAKGSEMIEISMNLDSREKVQRFNWRKPEETSSYSNSLTVYDNTGIARLVTVFFNKSRENVWEYHVMSDGKDVPGEKEGKWIEQASGELVFGSKGRLKEERIRDDRFNFNKGAAPNQKITWSFGQSIAEGGNGTDASTQYGSKSTTSRHVQDGSSASELASLSFDDKGVLIAVYSNGSSREIAQVGISKFENNEGLFKLGKNLYKESKKSGQPVFGYSERGGRGAIVSKSLELSNVDIANEFVNLMTSQRNFQANARSITTADQMLQEVLGLKR